MERKQAYLEVWVTWELLALRRQVSLNSKMVLKNKMFHLNDYSYT